MRDIALRARNGKRSVVYRFALAVNDGKTMIHQDTIAINSAGHGAMTDLTDRVQQIVAAARVQVGVAHVFAVGSTAALGVIEFEPGLQKDLPQTLDRLIPPSRSYGHEQAWHD